MNYFTSYNGNLPCGCTQADIDAVFGAEISDRAIEAMDEHIKARGLIAALAALLKANDGTLGFSVYEDLLALLEGAEMDGGKIEETVLDAEERDRD